MGIEIDDSTMSRTRSIKIRLKEQSDVNGVSLQDLQECTAYPEVYPNNAEGCLKMLQANVSFRWSEEKGGYLSEFHCTRILDHGPDRDHHLGQWVVFEKQPVRSRFPYAVWIVDLLRMELSQLCDLDRKLQYMKLYGPPEVSAQYEDMYQRTSWGRPFEWLATPQVKVTREERG